jgi:hypothetical protein
MGGSASQTPTLDYPIKTLNWLSHRISCYIILCLNIFLRNLCPATDFLSFTLRKRPRFTTTSDSRYTRGVAFMKIAAYIENALNGKAPNKHWARWRSRKRHEWGKIVGRVEGNCARTSQGVDGSGRRCSL